MVLKSERLDGLLSEGANWAALEYLVYRFNRTDLDGEVILRKTALFHNLQLCFVGESCGHALTILSESFSEDLITNAFQQRHLVETVSRFLLKVKGVHHERCSGTNKDAFPPIRTAIVQEIPPSQAHPENR